MPLVNDESAALEGLQWAIPAGKKKKKRGI